VREKEGEILHLFSAGDAGKLKPGPAELVLDSLRRRDITVQHTGQHLLSGIILRMTGTPTVSMHLGDETCTIDVDTPELRDETLVAIEDAVADAIAENKPVIIHLCPPEDIFSFPLRKLPPQGEEVIRVVEIAGYDFSPCCGTHLKSTAEIGILRILTAEKYKGMTRIYFIAGRRVLLDNRLLRHNAGIVSRTLKVPIHETGKGVLDYLEKTAQIEKQLKLLLEEACRVRAEALLRKAALFCESEPQSKAAHPAFIIESYADAGIDEVLCIGRAAQKETEAALASQTALAKPVVIILVSGRDLKFAAFCLVKDFDLRPIIKGALEAQSGRGGGSSSFFQGSFGTKEALNAFIRAMENQQPV
jgi:alanyl-tRNA synthetase